MKNTIPNRFSPQGQVFAPEIRVGVRVLFTPKCDTLGWAAGKRTVAGFDVEMIRLECGNIKLLAKPDEITIL